MAISEVRPFLSAEDVGGGTNVEIVSEFDYVDLQQKDGTTKRKMQGQVKLPSGGERTWTLNQSTERLMVALFGADSAGWIGKTIEAYAVDQKVFGEMKKVVYARASEEAR